MAKYSLEQIRSAYIQKKAWEKQFPINYFFVRPLSFYLSYLVLKITRSPARVAIFGFILGSLGCLSLACSYVFSLWPGLLLIVLYSISDAVDGNIARATQNVTLFGKYLDGILGDLIDGSYFFFLGIGLYFSGGGLKDPIISAWVGAHAQAVPLFLGSLILISKLWAILFQTRYEAYRIQKEGLPPLDESQTKKIIGKSKFSDRWYYLIFINLDCLNNQLLMLTLFTVLKLEIWFLVFFACFFTSKAFLFFFSYFEKTKSKLLENIRWE